VRIIEELLERKISGCGLEDRDELMKIFLVLTTQHPLPTKVDFSSQAAAVDQSM
jgi:hypothetical protein